MMMKRMIFHHPEPLPKNSTAGSQVRPLQMIEGFHQLGYEVELVVGYGNERKRAAERIYSNLAKGLRYDFIYSESSTTPTLLTETHHFPTYPFLELGLFRQLKKMNVPIGLFYRDVYWRFPLYHQVVPLYKRMITIPFYWFDWILYKRLVDLLLLPSMGMKNSLPGKWPEENLYALPPGGIISQRNLLQQGEKHKINLFYVGGVTPPLYDIKPMTEAVKCLKDVHLTICCLSNEWNKQQPYYSIDGSDNIKIVHSSGEELENYYENTDIFAIFRQSHPYLKFAMPVKLFEAIGHGVPIILSAGTEASKLIIQEGIGWSVSSPTEFTDLLTRLLDHPEDIKEKQARVLAVRERHSWVNRAKLVAELLTT